MKKTKKICLVFGLLLLVVLAFIVFGHFLSTSSNSSESDELIMNATITDEQKNIFEQEYIEDKIEEALNECEFETEEEKSRYREMLLEQIQKQN